MKTAGVVLAAGTSTRMGRNKLLLPFRGMPLAAHALRAMAGSDVTEVICVVGFQAAELVDAMGAVHLGRAIRFLQNPEYASGRSSSIKAALLAAAECRAVVFLPADVPLVTAGHVDRLLEEYGRSGARIVAAVSEGGRRTHPVLFDRSLFPALMALSGDTGGNAIIREHWPFAAKVVCPDPVPSDVDTEADYAGLLGDSA